VPGETPADASTCEDLPEAFGLTRQYLVMDAAVECGQDPFEAMRRWTPTQAESAIQLVRIRRAIADRKAESLALLRAMTKR